MMANETPCGRCKCCEAGKRCANVLLLDAKDRAVLEQLERRGFGNGSHVVQRHVPLAARTGRTPPPEPTIMLTCSSCKETFEALAYVVNVFKTRGFTPQRCESCRYAGKERVDLA